MGCLVIFGIGLLMVFGVQSCISNANKNNGFKNDADTARAYCRTLVEEQLKAPSTADYPFAGSAQRSGDDWTVSGSVDSQNSFGAKVRSSYTCQLHWAGSSFSGTAAVG